ncbi:MAG: competence/damage-inducible protein A [Thermodesulfovibrionales bacterium]|nr:competence/damage-inducible protein A [Thermodesulfovibrionales bacterium]
MAKTAGIIIIGDEILSGKVQDLNSQFMAKELRLRGIDVRRISVIPDDIGEIAREVKEFSKRFDYVFTSGGIGPTHDDVTIEGIAEAFNVKTVLNNSLKKLLYKKYGVNLTPEQLKMAEVPEGAELLKDEPIKFPLILFKNIYILPGIPEYLKEKFFVIEKLFNEPPILLKKVYIREYEPEIAPFLNEIVKSHKDVKIGSYPVLGNEDYYVMVTLESLDEESLNSALEDFINKISREKVTKVEG